MSSSRQASVYKKLEPIPYHPKSRWTKFRKFVGERVSWVGVSGLSVVSVVPVAIKFATNLAIGIVRNTAGRLVYGNFNVDYFKQSGLNLVTSLGLVGTFSLGIIGFVKPSIPGSIVKAIIYPAPSLTKSQIEKKAYTDKKFKLDYPNFPPGVLYSGVNWKNKMKDELLKEEDKIFPKEPLFFCDIETPEQKILPFPAVFFRAPLRFFNKVIKEPQIPVKTVEIPAEESLVHPLKSKYRIYFGGNGDSLFSNYDDYEMLKELHCHTIGFNYSGIMNDHTPESIDDLVKDGIAVVYAMANEKCWTQESITRKLHFHGFSLGGGIALQVAAHFKEKHNIDIKVFVDRSFWDLCYLAALQVNQKTGIPFVLAHPFCALAFYGSGDWNLNSLAALKKLDPRFIYYQNLIFKDDTKSSWDHVKTFFGLGWPSPSPDSVILQDADLASGIKSHASSSHTLAILKGLRNEDSQCIIPPGSKYPSHIEYIKDIFHYQKPTTSALQLYKDWLKEDPSEVKIESKEVCKSRVLSVRSSV